MTALSLEEIFSGLERVPWERLVRFYGRATDIPRALRDLASAKPEARHSARERLSSVLVHQDSVSQATPFAAPFLVRLLASPDVEEKAELVKMLGVLLDAARFQLGGARPSPLSVTLDSLASLDKQWPAFVSDVVDEGLWEEWNPPDSDWLSWAVLTERAVVEGSEVIRQLAETAPGMAAAATLLGRSDLPEGRASRRPVEPPVSAIGPPYARARGRIATPSCRFQRGGRAVATATRGPAAGSGSE